MMSSLTPLFIISQPRAGSTLLQSLLSNNQYVATASEPWLLLPLLSVLSPRGGPAVYDHALAQRAVSEFLAHGSARHEFETGLRDCILRTYGTFADSRTRYFLDKTPRYYLIAEQILDILPNARVVVLKRHPLAVLDSILRTSQAQDDLAKLEIHRTDILEGPRLIHDFCTQLTNDERVRTLKYEDLVTDPEPHVKALYEWLEIPFSKQVLDYGNNLKLEGSLGDQVGLKQARRPVPAPSSGWRPRLDSRYWRAFFQGYSHYLGKQFFTEYGGYTGAAGGDTKVFNYFRYGGMRALRDKDMGLGRKLQMLISQELRLWEPPGRTRKAGDI
ncbi:MAG: sulfotransferase [Verrucomicrobia bacterium]|jgi:hypothetical protein|nr:sulfotransferase [Verrucomicrobiota bacterium]